MWSIHQYPGQYYDPVRDCMRNVQHRMYPNEHMGHFNSPHEYALWSNYNAMYSRNAGVLNTGFAGGTMPQAHDARQARRDYITWHMQATGRESSAVLAAELSRREVAVIKINDFLHNHHPPTTSIHSPSSAAREREWLHPVCVSMYVSE
ncbi:hypothetical protein LTR95_008858 [Oleoguttula sp. CCFEE 5521]